MFRKKDSARNEWAQRFAENEDETMRELIHLYGPRLKRSARLLLPIESDIDEVLQRTFIQAWQGFSGFREQADPGTWLHRILVNEALGLLRKEKRHRNKVELTDIHSPQNSSSSEGQQNPLFILMELLHLLPERQRLIFQLRYFEEMPIAQIATKTGLTEGAIKANFHLARKKIEAYIKIRDLY